MTAKSRVPPSVLLGQQVSHVFEGLLKEEQPIDSLVRMGAQLILQTFAEWEATRFLGREHYKHGEAERPGMRNGYRPKTIHTGDGGLAVQIPELRGTQEPFQSIMGEDRKVRTQTLERLALMSYVKGLSTRDIEDLYKEGFGAEAPSINRSEMSELAEDLTKEFDRWKKRTLDHLELVYLFLDAIFLPVRQDSDEEEGVLAAYGILAGGKRVLLHLALGNREDYQSWLDFLRSMIGRGLRAPLLVISDGAPGLIKAIKHAFPRSTRQRCQVHKMNNLMKKLPRKTKGKIKSEIHDVFYSPTFDEGMSRGRALIEKYKNVYPSAMECLEADLEPCLVYLKFPHEHWKSIRTTNLMERTFGEGRRRTKVIPRFPTERSCLKLLYATLLDASKKWRGVKVTVPILSKLDEIRKTLYGEEAVKEVS